MNDFREFFDLRKLDDRQLGFVEFVINSPAYGEVFEPYLKTVRESMNKLWLDRSQARKDQYPDDFLAGGICAIDGLIKFFNMILSETQMERIHASMSEMTPEKLYELKRQRGQLRPVVGVNQGSEPEEYNPADDF